MKQLKADNDSVTEETTTGFAGLAPDGAEDYTAIAAQGAQMQEVAQGQEADNAQVPAGANSVSVHGSAGTSVSLAAPSLGTTTRGGGIILPQCTRHALDTYYATDHLGTVRFVKTVDETGTEVATTTHDYEPFGVEITPAYECDNTHRFTGHERDTETGNDYMHFRFFSASMGRFQKPDSNFDNPTSNPQGWNLYSYVKGNPVNFNDPTGHITPGGRGPVDGPLWAGSAHRSSNPFEFSAPFVSREGDGTIGSANTFSMLGQTMNPQATGQAAQTSMFGATDYSFKLDPTVPKPAAKTTNDRIGLGNWAEFAWDRAMDARDLWGLRSVAGARAWAKWAGTPLKASSPLFGSVGLLGNLSYVYGAVRHPVTADSPASDKLAAGSATVGGIVAVAVGILAPPEGVMEIIVTGAGFLAGGMGAGGLINAYYLPAMHDYVIPQPSIRPAYMF